MSRNENDNLGAIVVFILCAVLICAICKGIYVWFVMNEQAIYIFVLDLLKLSIVLGLAYVTWNFSFEVIIRYQHWVRRVSWFMKKSEQNSIDFADRMNSVKSGLRDCERLLSSTQDTVLALRKFTKYDEALENAKKVKEALAALDVKLDSAKDVESMKDDHDEVDFFDADDEMAQ
jgi:hypothetical protein